MIEWKPNEPEVQPGQTHRPPPPTDFITVNEDIPLRDLLDDAIAIKARLDERAEGASNGR